MFLERLATRRFLGWCMLKKENRTFLDVATLFIFRQEVVYPACQPACFPVSLFGF
jgi:hypothetical protein